MALRATSPAPIITFGLEVLVQEVIAAITTSPWPISNFWPRTFTRLLRSLALNALIGQRAFKAFGHIFQPHPVLRAFRPGQARMNAAQIKRQA